MRLKAPFPWFGGKSRAAELIWSRLGNPRHYIEPFAGSLAVLLRRPHEEPGIETVNDLDCYLANFWRAVAAVPGEVAYYADDPVNEADLHARHAWLVGRKEFRERMKVDPEHFDPRVAGWWVWGLSCWIGSGWCDARRWGRDAGSRPDLGDKKSGQGRGVHQKRPNLTGNGGSMAGVHRKMPQLNAGGGGGVGRGVHLAPGSSTPRRRPGPQNTGGFGPLGAPGSNDLLAWFAEIQHRLRRVRVCCGDWTRVVTPAVLGAGGGTTAVLLDPPYDTARRSSDLYAHDRDGLADQVREWAIENGDRPRLRIALCGLTLEHDMPVGWEPVSWTGHGGYGNQDGGDHENRHEVVWFSPHCLRQPTLFDQEP